MKNKLLPLLTLICILNSHAQTALEKEAIIRLEINEEFDKNSLLCDNQVDAVTNTHGKTEFWRICELDNGNRILQIESHKKSIYYQEIYFEKDGILLYAKETENYTPNNHYLQMQWHCKFYARNGTLLSYTSLGHGKTEEDIWSPEIIFNMYRKRLDELEKIKK